MIEKVVVYRDGGTISFSGSFHYQIMENEENLNESENLSFDYEGTLCVDFRIKSENGGLYKGYPEDSEKIRNKEVVKRVIEDVRNYDLSDDRREGLKERAVNALTNYYNL